MLGTIRKKVFSNGLVALVLERHHIPKVSLQLWYGVGSKDELSGQRGAAHLIEHMIFKGTQKFSESDISALVHRLSGSCNAFTSQDYTGYLFDIPSQHWFEVLPVMADCMTNCTFREQMLASELKAVIQELKMYNDDYLSTLIERVTTAQFPDHPYHHPVIGYKHDLWSMTREHLLAFYHYHYVPNNAAMIVVGDVDADDVFDRIEREFGSIPAQPAYARKAWHHSFDLSSQSIILRRDISQPLMLLSWQIPGVVARKDYLLDLLSWVIGAGRGACLYNKLVTEMGIATEVQTFVYDLFDQGLFCVYVQPRSLSDRELIRELVAAEIEHYRVNKISDAELARAQRKTAMDFISLGESNQKLAYLLGKFYTATGDENYLLNYLNHPIARIKDDIKELCDQYLSPSLMSCGEVLPLMDEDKKLWLLQQEQSDAEDARVLSAIVRHEEVAEPLYAPSVAIAEPKPFDYPKAQTFELSNGLKVFAYHRQGVEKVDLIIDLKTKHFYDAPEKSGLNMLMTDLLQEGTKKHNAQELALEIESLGMELNTFPGQIGMTMLSTDVTRGLNLLHEVLTEPLFEEEAIDRVRNQMIAEIRLFWDTPVDFAAQLARELVYRDHPLARAVMGNEETLLMLTRDDVVAEHAKCITPRGGRLAIVGDLSHINVQQILQESLGSWTGPEVPDMVFPPIPPVKAEAFDYQINRDQVVLAYAGLSVARLDPDFDPILLFDQIFTGGVLGSMNSRLFDLREKTGMFYAITGSLLAGVTHQPGMFFIKAITSGDRLEEAEKAIEGLLQEGANRLSPTELEETRAALVNSMVDNFSTNRQMAATFLALDFYGLPADYFDKRAAQLEKISADDIKRAVANILDIKKMVKMRIGRQ